MKANGLSVQDCEGWNSFGFANLCMQGTVLAGKEYKQPITWYGGDDSVFDPTTLYNDGTYS